MRAPVSIALLVSGVCAAGALWIRSSGGLRPRDPRSLAERLAVLRLSRSLVAAPDGVLSLQAGRTVLRTDGASGAMEISCADGSELAQALGRAGANPGCTEQSIDDPADVVFYDVGGRAPALCPGQFSGATEEQLHHALYLPALAAENSPAGVLSSSAGFPACGPDDSTCALANAPGIAIVCGVVRSCEQGVCAQGAREDLKPEDVAASLTYAQLLARDAKAAPAECSAPGPNVHVQASAIISEAVTASTVASFALDEPWAMRGLASPGSADTASELRRYFAQRPRGVCFLVKGLDLERPADADRLARALAFPVFPAADPRAPGRATPLARALQSALPVDAKLKALLPPCDLVEERSCALQRERIAANLRGWLSGLKPAPGMVGSESIAAHIAASGPFRLASRSPFHLELRSVTPRNAAPNAAALTVRQQLLAPEMLHGAELRCEGQHKLCVYRGLPSAVTVHPASQSDAAQDPWALVWLAADPAERASHAAPADVAVGP